ncbi:MAG TPA: hypothetical protein VGA97_02405 [Acidimicrobiia bacterium]
MMALMSRTSLRTVADQLLRTTGPMCSLNEYIAARRAVRRTWAEIAAEVTDLTNGLVQVTWITIQRWADVPDEVAS